MPQTAQQIQWDSNPQAGSAPPLQVQWDDAAKNSPSTPPPPPSAMRRFMHGMLVPDADVNHMPSTEELKAHPIANNPMIPGTGVYRDIKARNYAGALGRVARPVAALAPFLFSRGAGESANEFTAAEGVRTDVEGGQPQAHELLRKVATPNESGNARMELTPRRLPGEVASEATRPRATYGGLPPKPIPPREGLLLKGEVARPIEGDYVETPATHSNEPPFASATEVAPRQAEPAPSPYRMGRGQVAPDVIRPEPQTGFEIVRKPPYRSRLLGNGNTSATPTPIAKPSWTPPRASQFNPVEIGGPEDVAETRAIQEKIRDDAEQETAALRKRGNEEGFARNTRPRIAKGEMTKNFREEQGFPTEEKPVKLTTTKVAKPGATASGRSSVARGSNSEKEDLTDLLEESVKQAKAKKAAKR